MRKLKVQELENRIAPSVGLFGLLAGIAEQDADFGNLFHSIVDQDANVDVGAAAAAANSAGLGTSFAPAVSTFNMGNVVVSDATANAILGLFGR